MCNIFREEAGQTVYIYIYMTGLLAYVLDKVHAGFLMMGNLYTSRYDTFLNQKLLIFFLTKICVVDTH